MNSSESAEAIVKMSLEGIEVAAKITGAGAKNLAVLLYTLSKDKKMTKGKIKLNDMLKSGNSLQIFSLKEEQLKKFNEEAKRYGVLYTALVNKRNKNGDGMVDLMVRAEDAPKVNRIIERFKLSAIDIVSIKSEVQKEKIEEMLKDAKERGVEVKSVEEKLVDEIMTKPIQKQNNEMENPKLAKTEKSPLSELSSENKNKKGVVSIKKKPSVRETLKKIKNELKDKETDKSAKEKTKSNLINENGKIHKSKKIKNKGKGR